MPLDTTQEVNLLSVSDAARMGGCATRDRHPGIFYSAIGARSGAVRRAKADQRRQAAMSLADRQRREGRSARRVAQTAAPPSDRKKGRFTPEEVTALKIALDAGSTKAHLARVHGCSWSTIHRAVSGAAE